MVEVFQDPESLLDDGVGLVALDMGNESDAARVMLVRRVVQAMGSRVRACLETGRLRGGLCHHALRRLQKRPRLLHCTIQLKN
jgi:hypothetical protein